MAPYIFGARNNIHIIDLAQTVPMLHQALQGRVRYGGQGRPRAVRRHQAPGAGRIAECRQALGAVFRQFALARRHADQLEDDFGSIKRLRKVDEMLNSGAQGLTKKERLMLSRERDKLEKALGGIKDMGGTPDLMFVIDTNKEAVAIKEANRLNIPVAPSSTPTAIRTASLSRFRAMTTPAAPSRSIAISIARAAIDGIGAARAALRHRHRRRRSPTAGRAAGRGAAADEPIQGEASSLGPARRADDLEEAAGRRPAIEKKLNDLGIFHYWQIAA
jgi:small subunit ribosomal protein S2